MRLWTCLLVVGWTTSGLIACSSADADITLRFASPEARAQTRLVAFTAFEPILAQPDTIDQVPRFVTCDEVGVFGPTRIIDPATISTVPNLAGVVSERTSQTFPLDDDWQVDLQSNALNEELNPWGAVMVFVEARGDARAPASQGGGQISTTLLSGCFCLRTTPDGSYPDASLDQRVKQACPSIEGDGSVTSQVVELNPVAPEPFRLETCNGFDQLTAPRNELLAPGPGVCLETTQCNTLSIPGPCFDCEQPCSELDDMANVPVQFEVFRGNRLSSEETQVVLTDVTGRAEAQVDIGTCAEPIRIEAQVIGRTNERASFDVACVESVAGFDCPVEVNLATNRLPRAMTRVVGNTTACANGDLRACDRIAVLSDDGGTVTELTIHDALSGAVLTSTSFQAEKGHAIHGYFYEPPGAGRPGSNPLLAVATSNSTNALRMRVFQWDYERSALIPHDGGSGLITAACDQWLCGSLQPCSSGVMSCADSDREVCSQNTCQLRGMEEDGCSLEAPVFCNCEQKIEFQTRVTLRSRDLDNDGFADLAVGNSGELNIHILYSGRRTPGTLYGDNCTCGQFGVTPNVFGLMTLGGAVPTPTESDLVLGSNGGLFVKYADRISPNIPVSLHCGQPRAVGDNAAVRDLQVAPLRCRLGELTCAEYEDVVAVSARTVAGGSLNDPGAVRVLSGSPVELDPARIPPGVRRELVPRRFEGRPGRPEDPQRAQVADFNSDGHLDFAVLYKGSQEIHVWLGASNGGFGEVSRGILLDECDAGFSTECPPLSELIAVDGDGDGRSELAVICSPSQAASLRVYAPN